MVLGWHIHLNILDPLDIWMPGAGMKLPHEQYGTMGKEYKTSGPSLLVAI